MVVDAENLNYISSVGLRAMLTLKKKISNFKIINVTDSVYEVFDVTKFTDIMCVEKAYRKISIDNCVMLGKGACGTVYKLDSETIVKVFADGYEFEKIIRERENSQNAFVHGVDTAIPFDIVKVGDNYGLIYEIINAETLKTLMTNDREKIEYYIGIYADYVKNMHSITFGNNCYPKMKQIWIDKIDGLGDILDDSEKKAVKEFILKIPDRKNFIHGDINLGNLMVSDGKATLIDLENALLGHPIFDVAFIYSLFKLLPDLLPAESCELIVGFNKEENKLLWNKFSEIYFGCKTDEERALYEADIHIYGIIKLFGLVPFCYSMFEFCCEEQKKYVSALLDAFETTIPKHKKELFDAIRNSAGLHMF